MKYKTTHDDTIVSLRRIEGQIKGIQRMVENGEYCIDIATQMHAAINGLHKVAEKVLTKHMEHCVVDAIRGGSEKQKREKIDEIMEVMKRLRKL